MEGAVAEVVLDAPVATDPGGEFAAVSRAGRQARDQVDQLDRKLACSQVLSPADDLEGLAGMRVVEVGEKRGCFQTADLVAVVAPASFVVVQAESRQGRRRTLSWRAGWLRLITAR